LFIVLSTPVAQATDYSRFVVGYHGCDLSVAKAVLLGTTPLQPVGTTMIGLGLASISGNMARLGHLNLRQ